MKHLIFFLGALMIGGRAEASVIFDNGAPDLSGTASIAGARTADDFTLGADTSVLSLQLWMSVFPLYVFSGSISYAFYDDSGGSIGALIASGTRSGLTLTPVAPIYWYTLQFDLQDAVSLAAGHYWLELHEGTSLSTDDGSDMGWGASNEQSGYYKGGPLSAVPNTTYNWDLAFRLFDTQVPQIITPEPDSILLTSLGLAYFGIRARRRIRRG
ncbi:MAG TPA: hypothetical protein VGJ09_18555 [Bryobacteraceae bacterium]